MALLMGYLLGLSFVIFVGPVVFTLLKSTLHQGRTAGMMVALGILISDVVVVAICIAGYSRYFQEPQNKFYIGIVGAAILFAISVRYMFKPASAHLEQKLNYSSYFKHFAKGFMVNGINPFVFGVWLVVISEASDVYKINHDLSFYLAGSLLGIISTDTAKVMLAHRIKHWFEPEKLRKMYRVFGFIMLGFVFYILYEVFFNLCPNLEAIN